MRPMVADGVEEPRDCGVPLSVDLNDVFAGDSGRLGVTFPQ